MKVKSILVSQPTPAVAEKSPYYEIHTKFGASLTYHPFIRIEGVTLKEYRSQRTEILDHSVIIFTSRTTIDHFFRICEEARVNIPETMKYICNTEATALYLQKYIVYRKRKIFFADGTFSSLMELVMKHRDEKFLLTLSEPHKPEIPDTLDKLKIKYDKIILSRTVSADLSDINPSKYDMFVFFSPSEISALAAAFGTSRLPLIATFGNGTTQTAIEAGLSVCVMAPTPEAPSMAKAIELFINKVNAGEKPEPVKIVQNKQVDDFIKSQGKKPGGKKREATGKGVTAKPDVKANGSAATKKPAPAAAKRKVSVASKPGATKGAAE